MAKKAAPRKKKTNTLQKAQAELRALLAKLEQIDPTTAKALKPALKKLTKTLDALEHFEWGM